MKDYRTCIDCAHFEGDAGDWGRDAGVWCRRKHFEDEICDSADEYRETLHAARACPDFEDYKEEEANG